ncbi:MAG: NADH-quinone oxidoreductase subunit L [Sedimentisphaerales bacterium]|jgi:NADH-quinone oxidoreductase subunit L
MTDSFILLPIAIPFVAGLLVLLIGQQIRGVKEAIALLATAATLGLTITLFGENINLSIPWTGFGIDLALRLYHFSAFILVAAAAFSFLFVLYSCSFMWDKLRLNQFYSYLLITLAMTNGAVLADNLVLMLFFWEGLLLTLFGMIAIGRPGAYKTAIKAFIIVGISDLCLMMGIGLAGYLAGTMTISKINLSVVDSLGALAFILMMIGAISKAGSVPFHTWIPDAAVDAPLPFMAFLPASLEKLLGIYLLARISLDMFKLHGGSWISMLLMTIGAITILLAVMMALVQKDYKRLLSYHAVSQVGYMILGIGTCLPIGIVGGLFHMINHALYKSCLFLTGGAVEKQTGTTDLAKLGGLWLKMPVTFVCFVIAAASISGVPPFNGFYSKELVYDAALVRGNVFYLVAILGTFLTAASFLKLGHAAFLGKISEQNKNVRETSLPMLVPMIVIASVCVILGVWNYLPLNNLIKPILGEERLAGHEFGPNTMLITVTVIVLVGALLHHLFAAKVNGSGYKASDHIRHAPFLEGIYTKAENRWFDPYDIGMKVVHGLSRFGWWIDRAIDWLYEDFAVKIAAGLSSVIKLAHTGSYPLYVVWSLIGVLFIVIMLMKAF